MTSFIGQIVSFWKETLPGLSQKGVLSLQGLLGKPSWGKTIKGNPWLLFSRGEWQGPTHQCSSCFWQGAKINTTLVPPSEKERKVAVAIFIQSTLFILFLLVKRILFNP